MFVQCKKQNSEGIVQSEMQRNYNTEEPRPAYSQLYSKSVVNVVEE